MFVPGARNVRPSDGPNDVADSSCNDADDGTVDCKLNSLDGVMSEIAEDVRATGLNKKAERDLKGLEKKLASGIRRFDRGRYCRAQSDLLSLRSLLEKVETKNLLDRISMVREKPTEELLSRTKSALFTIDDELCDPR